MVIYPHPVIRMPITCRQCKIPKCAENCPSDAILVMNGYCDIDKDKCISCHQCVMACPFGAIFVHEDVAIPFKCDLCKGDPECVKVCPKNALLFPPEHTLGQAHRMASALKYTKMKQVEYVEEGKRRILKYADIERKKHED
jgi:Fe-S-cluster-containing hydrogenase component 2